MYLCRHGETEWNLTGQHTSFTDLSLTSQGIAQAKQLKKALQKRKFKKVFASPMQRAIETCVQAGYGSHMEILEDLSEWNYGKYEGRTTHDIRKEIPDWTIFEYGAKEGESIIQVECRAKRLIEKLQTFEGDIIVFSHGHFLRALGSVWLGLGAKQGSLFTLTNASVSILGYERGKSVIKAWNALKTDVSH